MVLVLPGVKSTYFIVRIDFLSGSKQTFYLLYLLVVKGIFCDMIKEIKWASIIKGRFFSSLITKYSPPHITFNVHMSYLSPLLTILYAVSENKC